MPKIEAMSTQYFSPEENLIVVGVIIQFVKGELELHFLFKIESEAAAGYAL